jgi:hypothetical protein
LHGSLLPALGALERGMTSIVQPLTSTGTTTVQSKIMSWSGTA